MTKYVPLRCEHGYSIAGVCQGCGKQICQHFLIRRGKCANCGALLNEIVAAMPAPSEPTYDDAVRMIRASDQIVKYADSGDHLADWLVANKPKAKP